MTEETIVAAFDTAADAQAAARDVEAANIPGTTVTEHAANSVEGDTGTTAPRKEPGFWSKLFGLDDDNQQRTADTLHDHTVYDRTLATGGSVLTVKVKDVERDADRVLSILEGHKPIDVEERANSYASTDGTAGATTASATAASYVPGSMTAPAANSGGDTQTVQLAEESLQVGKRVVNRGTTRIRRYVVETPVSEDVSLHNETVSIQRRPVTGNGAVAADAFSDKTIEVTEMSEEAVVAKSAHVVEEVVIRKDVNDRVETVHDTVRREQLEIDKVDETGATSKPSAKTL